ncbi:CinA-like protein [Bifidobacterium actinocoloniiforme DSM 22766]|uniref:CinA-like protein n=1 Tax=Bifidobacterium actinocoloniiforme DSM 22766 TaxID=1437605 RepID=A0A086Z0U3_9BIFI|nr:nicotinamide-nucleotide amidohydrolase family protein [Bifidobacterium actinocoloniiforme]AKV55338.1 damage-inducible protein CinA [Bifidobacterium actinocoloniiforme DSM 22766]KFI40143.1 CinA-like protein [Bifidobacterium actinocoloniiforme DSM 22766]
MSEQQEGLATEVLNACRRAGLFLAGAESLTGGLLADAFVSVPGASDVFLGSAVTYDIEAKASILGVDSALLAAHGAVHPKVAEQMALGAAKVYTQPGREGRVVGMATTGVAGPGPDGDQPAGLVYIALALPIGFLPQSQAAGLVVDGYHLRSFELRLTGSRQEVRRGTVSQVLFRLAQSLGASVR